MSLTRGNLANFPCPICLVPRASQSDIRQPFTLRTTASMRQVFDDAQALNSTARDNFLREYGLRDVEVLLFFLLCLYYR